jgi:hypothetical protein
VPRRRPFDRRGLRRLAAARAARREYPDFCLTPSLAGH